MCLAAAEARVVGFQTRSASGYRKAKCPVCAEEHSHLRRHMRNKHPGFLS